MLRIANLLLDRHPEPGGRSALFGPTLAKTGLPVFPEARSDRIGTTSTAQSVIDNATVSSSTFTLSATAAGPQPIKSIAYYIDDIQVGISDVAPFAFTYTAADLISGFHDIKAVATDAIGNIGSATITVNYLPAVVEPVPAPAPTP